MKTEMMKTEIMKTVKTTTVTTLELNRQDILDVLQQSSIISRKVNIDQVSMYVRIPGGREYSNTDLCIANDCPLIVEYKNHEEGSE